MSHNEANVKWRPQIVFSYDYMGSIEYKMWVFLGGVSGKEGLILMGGA